MAAGAVDDTICTGPISSWTGEGTAPVGGGGFASCAGKVIGPACGGLSGSTGKTGRGDAALGLVDVRRVASSAPSAAELAGLASASWDGDVIGPVSSTVVTGDRGAGAYGSIGRAVAGGPTCTGDGMAGAGSAYGSIGCALGGGPPLGGGGLIVVRIGAVGYTGMAGGLAAVAAVGVDEGVLATGRDGGRATRADTDAGGADGGRALGRLRRVAAVLATDATDAGSIADVVAPTSTEGTSALAALAPPFGAGVVERAARWRSMTCRPSTYPAAPPPTSSIAVAMASWSRVAIVDQLRLAAPSAAGTRTSAPIARPPTAATVFHDSERPGRSSSVGGVGAGAVGVPPISTNRVRHASARVRYATA